SAPSDMDGNFMLTIPAGPGRIIRANSGGVAVSSGNQMKTIPAIEFNVIATDTKPTAVKVSTKEAIPGLVSVTQMDGLGVLAGGVRDCDNKETAGAVVDVRVVDASGKDLGYDPSGKIFYFADVSGSTLPVRSLHWTGTNGAFAALNVPPGSGKVTVRAKIGSGDLQKLSEYTIPVIADS